MQRVFLTDVGRYKAGQVADYPLATWKAFFPNYQRDTKEITEIVTDTVVALHKETKRGRNYRTAL